MGRGVVMNPSNLLVQNCPCAVARHETGCEAVSRTPFTLYLAFLPSCRCPKIQHKYQVTHWTCELLCFS